MKCIFVSNFMNHHQLPFSAGLLGQDDVEYTFVALEPIPQERLDMGYEDMNHKYHLCFAPMIPKKSCVVLKN